MNRDKRNEREDKLVEERKLSSNNNQNGKRLHGKKEICI
jgi:hypothetical protein